MVHRLQDTSIEATPPSNAELMAIDLDGTYVQGNTLHIYLRCALRHHLRPAGLWRAAGIGLLLALRKMHLISHPTMKFYALALAGRDASLLDAFRREVRPLIHPKVELMARAHETDGGQLLLATAAADFYVPCIWNGNFVATPMEHNPQHRECRGTEKVRRVATWAAQHNARLAVVITDHMDDLPLLQANKEGKNYLVTPNGVQEVTL